MLETDPVVVHPNVAVREDVHAPGDDVIRTVGAVDVGGGGGGGGCAETVQVETAEALPPAFATMTRNVCVPDAR